MIIIMSLNCIYHNFNPFKNFIDIRKRCKVKILSSNDIIILICH